jgi:hypothetical protein
MQPEGATKEPRRSRGESSNVAGQQRGAVFGKRGKGTRKRENAFSEESEQNLEHLEFSTSIGPRESSFLPPRDGPISGTSKPECSKKRRISKRKLINLPCSVNP